MIIFFKSTLQFLLLLLIPITSFSQSFFEVLEVSTDEEVTIFNDFVMIDESRLYLINNRTQLYNVKIFNREDERIKQSFVRNGRGPGEVDQLGAFTMDEQKEHLFLNDFYGLNIKKFTSDGELVNEQPLHVLNVLSLTHSGSTLIATNALQFTTSETGGEKEKMSTLIDDTTLEVTGALYFDLAELSHLEEVENFNQIGFINVFPKTIQVGKDLYIVVFENINKVFLIDSDSKIVDQITLPIPNYRLLEATYSSRFDGWRIDESKVFYDFVRVEDSILLAFGGRLRDVPFGVANITVEQGRLLWSMSQVSDPDLIPQEEFLITSHNGTVWAFDGDKFVEIEFTEIK
ncbi:MAG: 6-bladed beta-propeller [Balneolales bacterium]|nr:6-bladed beta-propeller [Balneolales bacterium]